MIFGYLSSKTIWCWFNIDLRILPVARSSVVTGDTIYVSILLQMYQLTIKFIVLDYVGNTCHRQKATRESGYRRSETFNLITVRTHTHACAGTNT